MGILRDIGSFTRGIKAIGEMSRKSGGYINDNNFTPLHFSLRSKELTDLSFLWGKDSDAYLIELFHTVGEVFTPIDIIAKAVADGKPVVKRISSDAVVYSNQELNKLLESPNPLQTWPELVYQMTCFELVTGKSYLYGLTPDNFSFNYRNIATIQNLLVDSVMIDTGTSVKLLTATSINDLIKNFLVSDGANGQVKIAPEKVLYTKINSLMSSDLNIHGRSPMIAEKKAVEVIAAIYVALGAIYTKGGPRGMWVSAQSDAGGAITWSPIEKEKAVADIIRRYGFGEGQFPFGVTDQNIRYEKAGADIQDLQPKEIYKMLCGAIFALYNVPRELMPDADGSTYENQKQARKSVYENVAIPRAKSFYQSLSTWLKLEESGLYIDVDYSHVALLQENLKEKSDVDFRNNQTYKLQFINGIITLNEWRVACGMEAVGGNQMYNKLILDMEPDEIAKLAEVAGIGKGSAPASDNNNQNNNGDDATNR